VSMVVVFIRYVGLLGVDRDFGWIRTFSREV
jgi:hypothetical protein